MLQFFDREPQNVDQNSDINQLQRKLWMLKFSILPLNFPSVWFYCPKVSILDKKNPTITKFFDNFPAA